MSETLTDSQEIARLTKALQKQGAERRRLGEAFAKLKGERRTIHELQSLIDQQADTIDAMAEAIAKLEAGPLNQAVLNAKRSRHALSLRYGHLHRTLRGVLEGDLDDNAIVFALADVESRDWIGAQLAENDGGLGGTWP